MKPTKILSLFISINIGLLAMVYFFPEDGVKLSENFTLTFTTLDDLTHREEIQKVDITEIIQAHYLPENLDNLYTDADTTLAEEPKEVKVAIEHPDAFENPLFGLYDQLDQAKSGDQPLRILHFGDSQIEADRITGELRNQMQTRFGGCGVGMIPVTESSHARISVFKETSDNWKRHEIYGRKDKTVPHSDYGVMGYIHRFTPWETADSVATQTASISLKQNTRYYPNASAFEQVSLLHRNRADSATFALTDSGTPISDGELPISKGVQLSTWPINSTEHTEFELSLAAQQDLEVYGVCLDCANGVAVDNISWRGSSGIEFTKMEKDHLKGQFAELNVGMVIYEFGVNVVPHVIEDYSYYERQTLKELTLLRELLPNTPILVVGVSDMARSEKGTYASYPNIEKIRNAQRSAALEANCSFWDLYGAMGGQNAMVSWVEAKPSLAQKDYTHFNARGAKVVGEMLYQAIIEEYSDYKALQSI